ncbi:MAG: malate dehydrogenase (quinone) [Gammaproteobacteria bacterium]|nr:malate dehydrogenase (quinone) [Gammaproteobacteria bacterium]MDH5729511.1 malate dehydrogenase (quinone) [Gammaproteobacteria bacterium]
MGREQTNIVLVGAGIMSATLGFLLHKLMPHASIRIYERLDRVAAESSDAWNNAGTGHSAFCELNYTPYNDGVVDITKALEIAHHFEISKQLWAYLKETECLSYEVPFINDIPHMSFVWGEENVSFLEKRYQALKTVPIFQDMQYSNDAAKLSEWMPLIMEGRSTEHPYAATRMDIGTDVNFGGLAQGMIEYLQRNAYAEVYLNHQIENIRKQNDGRWSIEILDCSNAKNKNVSADYLFIGAGGGSLSLLGKSEIAEAQGYGGFPVSGHFLRCNNPSVIERHEAKVYGKAAVGSPPMSVPHLDTRIINGERTLFFGPYAGFTTKFLKNGSYLDLPLSIEMHNIWPMLAAGWRNVELTKYLVEQVMLSEEERFEELVAYYPNAEMKDWELITAGQRVQIIKQDEKQGGALKFGTEIVCSADRTIAALLGASPGASTSVSIMIDVLQKMFPEEMATSQWQRMLKEMIPSYGESLIENGELCLQVRARTSAILNLGAQ